MERSISKITGNEKLTDNIYKMTLETENCKFTRPGQFAMVEVKDKFLRRPISVSSYDSTSYTLVYKIVGDGTFEMSQLKEGDEIDVLTGLGNGYYINEAPNEPYVIGGGIGIPPMLGLLRELIKSGRKCKIVLGYNSVDELFLLDDFKELSDDIRVFTADGSFGEKGLVTDAFETSDYAFACGPQAMLKALDGHVKKGQFSLESRMGCGFGACMGCSIKTAEGSKRVCKEGPVFNKEDVLWEAL